jgi:hypothetical protein
VGAEERRQVGIDPRSKQYFEGMSLAYPLTSGPREGHVLLPNHAGLAVRYSDAGSAWLETAGSHRSSPVT